MSGLRLIMNQRKPSRYFVPCQAKYSVSRLYIVENYIFLCRIKKY